MIEFINSTDDELKSIFDNRTKEETFNFIIKILDCGNEMTNEEIDFIYKICEIKNISIDDIEEYFKSQEMLKN